MVSPRHAEPVVAVAGRRLVAGAARGTGVPRIVVHVDFPDGRRLVPVLLTTWAYSNCPFAIAVPTERTEAILHGLVEAFAFFGCVPRELWWDNPKTVVPHLLTGRERKLNDRYQALASHYL